MKRLSLLLLSIAAAAAAADVQYVPLDPPVMLPDGSSFLTWSDQTRYTRTIHVSGNDPAASDENPGTAERPLRTINRAAELVRPGERVLIHSGVYREMVQPASRSRGATSGGSTGSRGRRAGCRGSTRSCG